MGEYGCAVRASSPQGPPTCCRHGAPEPANSELLRSRSVPCNLTPGARLSGLGRIDHFRGGGAGDDLV